MSGLMRWVRAPSPSARALFLKRCTLIAAPGLLVGAGIELFMINTGFYNIVTRKEAERRIEAEDEDYQRYRRERKLAEQQQQQQQRR